MPFGFFKKKTASPHEVAPVLGGSQEVQDVEAGAWGAPVAPPSPEAPAAVGKQPASVAAAAPVSTEAEQSTGLLSKFKKKKPAAAEEEQPPRTLKQQFRQKKAMAVAGIGFSALVLVLAFFGSGAYKILNIICGGAGIVGGLFYFFASTIGVGSRVFFASSLVVVCVALASFGFNIWWLVDNFSSLDSWLSIPYVIVMLAAIGAEVFCIGQVGWRGLRVAMGKRRAARAQAQAQEFARQVG